MKKLTDRYRRWLAHRQRQAGRQKSALRISRGSAAWIIRRSEFEDVRRKLPSVSFEFSKYPGFGAFLPPHEFSFVKNYNETLGFVLDFRRLFFAKKPHLFNDGQRRRVYADFSNIQKIDPGAGLVLAAEIDRYVKSRPIKHEIHDHLWTEEVRAFFHEAGLFNLLKVDAQTVRSDATEAPERQTLRLRSGRARSGAVTLEILNEIERLSGKKVSARPLAYTAIAEALANVGHAYPDWYRSWPWKPSRKWWALGFWDASRNTVGLQLYDQGAGIPATLPRQHHWPKLLRVLEPERRDSGLIKAGLDYGRTSTDQPGRGKGLAEMADWIEKTGAGFLRILSGSGEVTYRPGGSVDRRDFDAPFCGTLIEWEVALDA